MKKISILLALIAINTCITAQNKKYTTPISRATQPVEKVRLFELTSPCVLKPDNPTFIEGSAVVVYGTWTIMGTNPTYQWYFNDKLLQGETNRIITVNKAGNYKLYTTLLFNGKVRNDIASVNVISTPAQPPSPTGTTVTTIKNNMVNGMAYKLYEPATNTFPTPKGILVIGSGNNENAPTVGTLTGSTENDLCKLAADNGYVAAVVAYTQGRGVQDWNGSALQMGNDFDACITDISTKYNVSKSKTVIAGVSYTSFMLYTNIATSDKLSYCKGFLGACGSTDSWKASNFKIPVYAINCAGNNEGDLNGRALYDAIPNSNPVKALSDGFTDASCNSHCGGGWVALMYNKLKIWVP
jgi:hypothetical protein